MCSSLGMNGWRTSFVAKPRAKFVTFTSADTTGRPRLVAPRNNCVSRCTARDSAKARTARASINAGEETSAQMAEAPSKPPIEPPPVGSDPAVDVPAPSPPPEAHGTPASPADADDDGPAVPIRGRLAAFLTDVATAAVIKRGCRRAGLEFDKHPRGDVPNPAALKDAIVLIEIAPTEDRRFDWCRRIKTLRPQTKVVLLLVVPSRPHVLQAARVGADVVLGHPVSTQLLVAKLNALLEPAPDQEPAS